MNERILRAAWEAGFRLCRSYGDNHAHFHGEQKERHWRAFLSSRCNDQRGDSMDEEKVPVYGFPCVEDPNDFHPDGESCSPEEIAAHRLACATYGTPAYQPNKGSFSEYDAEGKEVLRVLRTSWGIGTNYVLKSVIDPEPCETHRWVSQRRGGDPAEASSCERVTYCSECGEEPSDEMLDLPLSVDAADPQVDSTGNPSTREKED